MNNDMVDLSYTKVIQRLLQIFLQRLTMMRVFFRPSRCASL